MMMIICMHFQLMRIILCFWFRSCCSYWMKYHDFNAEVVMNHAIAYEFSFSTYTISDGYIQFILKLDIRIMIRIMSQAVLFIQRAHTPKCYAKILMTLWAMKVRVFLNDVLWTCTKQFFFRWIENRKFSCPQRIQKQRFFCRWNQYTDITCFLSNTFFYLFSTSTSLNINIYRKHILFGG